MKRIAWSGAVVAVFAAVLVVAPEPAPASLPTSCSGRVNVPGEPMRCQFQLGTETKRAVQVTAKPNGIAAFAVVAKYEPAGGSPKIVAQCVASPAESQCRASNTVTFPPGTPLRCEVVGAAFGQGTFTCVSIAAPSMALPTYPWDLANPSPPQFGVSFPACARAWLAPSDACPIVAPAGSASVAVFAAGVSLAAGTSEARLRVSLTAGDGKELVACFGSLGAGAASCGDVTVAVVTPNTTLTCAVEGVGSGTFQCGAVPIVA